MPNFFSQSPPSRTHPGNTISWRTNSIIAAPRPSLICSSHKRPATGDEDTSPPVDGKVSPVKGRSGRATGPKGTRPHNNARALALNKDFFQSCRQLPRVRLPTLPIDWQCGRITLADLRRNITRLLRKDPLFGVDFIDNIHKHV